MSDTLTKLMDMPQITTADLRKSMSDVFGDVHYNHKARLVTHYDKPMVVLVSPEDYLKLQDISIKYEAITHPA